MHPIGGAIPLAVACTVDVTDRRLVGKAVDQFGRLDVLVSDAGISEIGPMADLVPPARP